MAVEVPRKVFEGLERVRSEGRTNMLDRPRVARLAYENGDYAAAYSRGVFSGFGPVDEEGGGV